MAHMVNGDLLGHLNQSPRACRAAHEYGEEISGSYIRIWGIMDKIWPKPKISSKSLASYVYFEMAATPQW